MIVSAFTVGPFRIQADSGDGLGALVSIQVLDPFRREFVTPNEARDIAACLIKAADRAERKP